MARGGAPRDGTRATAGKRPCACARTHRSDYAVVSAAVVSACVGAPPHCHPGLRAHAHGRRLQRHATPHGNATQPPQRTQVCEPCSRTKDIGLRCGTGGPTRGLEECSTYGSADAPESRVCGGKTPCKYHQGVKCPELRRIGENFSGLGFLRFVIYILLSSSTCAADVAERLRRTAANCVGFPARVRIPPSALSFAALLFFCCTVYPHD